MATETATLLAQSTRHELALETQLEAVNNRLKEAKRRVRVVVPSKRHRTLHLRATLPAMPEEVQEVEAITAKGAWEPGKTGKKS